MAGDLTGVELKLGRAETHLAHLDRLLKDALHPDLYAFDIEYDAESGEHRYCVEHLPPIASDWRLIVGEILFNLRSALDHLACQLVVLDGKKIGKHTQFPIHEAPLYEKGKLVAVNLDPPVSNPKILKALYECQPYVGPSGEPMKAARHPLWQLRVLNNIDKHRLLLGVVHALDAFNPMYLENLGGLPRPGMRLNPEPLIDGSPVAGFDFGGAEPPADFDPHIALSVVIDEPDDLPFVRRVPVVRLLRTHCGWINHAVLNLHFRRLFP
jgi:hypothetical protein